VPKDKKDIKNGETSKYLLETVYVDDPEIIHSCARDCFVNEDGSINEKFQAWEKENKNLAEKFLKNLNPNTKPDKKTKRLSKENLGILANGRSQKKKS
jgi:hypothetical protein